VLINWQGISGTVYQFQLHPVGTPYLARSGVYIFCKLAPNGNWDAVYIGETDNFNRRLTEQFTLHHRWSCIRAAGATHICTLHVPGDLALREGIETDLRRLIQAPCNLQ
jgi:hypothetical protein